jgi:hypothetical protein
MCGCRVAVCRAPLACPACHQRCPPQPLSPHAACHGPHRPPVTSPPPLPPPPHPKSLAGRASQQPRGCVALPRQAGERASGSHPIAHGPHLCIGAAAQPGTSRRCGARGSRPACPLPCHLTGSGISGGGGRGAAVGWRRQGWRCGRRHRGWHLHSNGCHATRAPWVCGRIAPQRRGRGARRGAGGCWSPRAPHGAPLRLVVWHRLHGPGGGGWRWRGGRRRGGGRRRPGGHFSARQRRRCRGGRRRCRLT